MSKAIISSLRRDKRSNEVHTCLTVFNRGGNAGTLCVNTSDADAIAKRLLGAGPPEVAALVEACEYSVYLETVEPPASIEDRIQARLAMKAALAPFQEDTDVQVS
jgi:hypothetical protein